MGSRSRSAPQKQRMLLAALLLRPNEVVSNDELIDALWGEQPPERAAKSLQVYVWRLRKLLGRDVLQTRPPGYALRVSPEDLDLHRFEALRDAARSRDPIDAAELLGEALGLFVVAPSPSSHTSRSPRPSALASTSSAFRHSRTACRLIWRSAVTRSSSASLTRSSPASLSGSDCARS